jgi:hypothetical protein
LALSTEIIFPYRHLEPQDASDKVRELHASEALCFCRRIRANRPAPVWLFNRSEI